jgi:hypothetical protein
MPKGISASADVVDPLGAVTAAERHQRGLAAARALTGRATPPPVSQDDGKTGRSRPAAGGSRPRRGQRRQSPAPEPAPRTEPQAATALACPKGHPSPDGARFCVTCGAALTEPPKPVCSAGHENPDGAKFCQMCGIPLEIPFSAAANADAPNGRPRPLSELTEEERAERERQHAEALAAGRRDDPVRWMEGAPEGTPTVLIHFVEDGVCAFGVVWMRGQELELAQTSKRFIDGGQWMLMGDAEQMRRFGRVLWRQGPWPGERSYTAAAGHFERLAALGSDKKNPVPVPEPGLEELSRADAAEQARGRRVPELPVV